mmetsp:Transcript_46560/g.113398  ORF Transcript_46560/g.113398 Transcript_46560/m.113398 type:complete len:613 (+) Transcript_46560:284-2122(+)
MSFPAPPNGGIGGSDGGVGGGGSSIGGDGEGISSVGSLSDLNALGPYSFVGPENRGISTDICSTFATAFQQQPQNYQYQQQQLNGQQNNNGSGGPDQDQTTTAAAAAANPGLWPWPFWRNDDAAAMMPVSNPSMKFDQNELDKTLAKDMLSLSMEERREALEDLHGVEQLKDEDEVEMQRKLEEIENELQRLRRDELNWNGTPDNKKDTSAYVLAEATDRAYVHDRKFRMMFLRATRYDPLVAAERMLVYFSMKKRLFGADKLCKKITIDECFNDDDLETLKQGWVQISPYKDARGRKIVYSNGAVKSYRTIENAMRANFYVFMTAVEDDEEAQRRGIVWVVLDLNSKTKSSGTGVRDSIPVCFRAIHFAYNGTNGKTEWRAATKNHSVQKRVRLRLYHGSQTEVLYQLMSYGIPREAAPVKVEGGGFTTHYHEIWLQQRLEIERKAALVSAAAVAVTSASVVCSGGSLMSQSAMMMQGVMDDDNGGGYMVDDSYPLEPSGGARGASSPATATTTTKVIEEVLPDDVLFGKDRRLFLHPGNTRLRQLVDANMQAYTGCNRTGKAQIARSIVKQIHQSNGRFLKRGENGMLEEVSISEAQAKVAHAFRNRRKK